MKYNRSLFVCCLLVMLSFKATRAQSFSSETYTNHSLLLRSDFPSKSVLVSTLFSDRVGDMSPVIGAASWVDSGRQLQARSLLEFNYRFLPEMIINDPSLVTSAELILYPVQTASSRGEFDKPFKLLVRRILDCWDDSTTMWINQPVADSSARVVEIYKKIHRNKPVTIDVTRLVIDMLRFGNKGFMICNENSTDQSLAQGQWFASPKNNNESQRPLLVINYSVWDPSLSRQEWVRETGEMRGQMNMRQQTVNNAPIQVHVKTTQVRD